MSTVVFESNTDFVQDAMDLDGGREIVLNQEEENILTFKTEADLNITGGKLNDVITTGAGDAMIFGGDGDDIIRSGNGSDILRGGKGDDTINGGFGNDTIIGGAGDDVILGGKGEDLLKGGDGADIFKFAADEFDGSYTDKIVDFKDDDFADTIEILGVGTDGNVSYDETSGIVSVNGNAAIDIGAGQEVEFEMNEDNDTWKLF